MGAASGRPVPLPPPKVQALLAYLAVRPGVAQPRQKLAVLLWGDAPAERARHSLRQALLLLRQALPAGLLREEGDIVALSPDGLKVECRGLRAGSRRRDAGGAGAGSPPVRGRLLAGLGEQAAPFEEWLLPERERLRELALEAEDDAPEAVGRGIPGNRPSDPALGAVRASVAPGPSRKRQRFPRVWRRRSDYSQSIPNFASSLCS
jgi:DNA-binding SARP family transcriptional activator